MDSSRQRGIAAPDARWLLLVGGVLQVAVGAGVILGAPDGAPRAVVDHRPIVWSGALLASGAIWVVAGSLYPLASRFRRSGANEADA